MTERTKVERFLNPQTVEDYALTLTADEARQVPELAAWIEAHEHWDHIAQLQFRFGANAGRAVAALCFNMAEVHKFKAEHFRAGYGIEIAERNIKRGLEILETIADILNGMDAVPEEHLEEVSRLLMRDALGG